MNALQLCHWQFSHEKKLCSRLSSSEVRFLEEKRPFCVFELPFGDLGAMYDYHLKLIGKRVGDFLLVLIELFTLGINLLGKTETSHFSKLSRARRSTFKNERLETVTSGDRDIEDGDYIRAFDYKQAVRRLRQNAVGLTVSATAGRARAPQGTLAT